MKFFKKEPEKTILFVCVENAGRSQIAEGFFNQYAPKGYKGNSGGTKPVSQINPIVVEVMKEVGIDISNQKSKDITDVGIDISNQKSKDITEDMMRNSFKTVNMGCMDNNSCPMLFLPPITNSCYSS